MKTIIADLQLHSKYSRAVSKEMTLPNICAWTKRKGMGLVATGDWTHPLWMKEIKAHLEETGTGLLKLKTAAEEDPQFLLASEVSCIYTQNGKGRRVHTLIWVPTIASADKINKEMTKQGCNLMSDGRPIIGLSSIQVADLVLNIEPNALVIPAHAWTPWFSVYGSKSGFDSIEEAFGPYANQIYAVETGLSSNPSMNWRITELDNRSIVSFSDAHSGPKLGRESTVFELPELNYENIRMAIMAPSLRKSSPGHQKKRGSVSETARMPRIISTLEFYPEEGKYHWSGHRACNIRWGPKETEKNGTTCPVCGKPLIQGVEQRVSELAGRSEADLRLAVVNEPVLEGGVPVHVTKSAAYPDRAKFTMLVPLQEILSECIGSPVASPKVQTPYGHLVDEFRGEFSVLLKTPLADITHVAGERIAKGIEKVRTGDLVIDPGYDGVFGVVKLWKDDEDKPLVDPSKEQLHIF